jgi:uroporphyrinogen III methyltransferase / synthase
MGTTNEISGWVQRFPLEGKTILVTRAVRQAEEFSTALRSLGAQVIEFPTIQICDPESWDELDRCLTNLNRYDGLIFTSANAVEKFCTHSDGARRTAFRNMVICAVGAKTQEALTRYHLSALVVPERYTADELIRVLQDMDIRGKRFLFPRGSKSGSLIRSKLEKSGATVDECIVYRTEYIIPASVEIVRDMLTKHEIDVVTFFSPSSVEGFFRAMLRRIPEPDRLTEILRGIHTASIGLVTAEALREKGLVPMCIPAVSTSANLVDSIVRFFIP